MSAAPQTGRRYGGKTAQERDDDRRRRLLDAALELFGTQGYAATTIPQLCKAAGISTASFYPLFSSREAVLKAVYDEVIGQVAAGAAAELLEGPLTSAADVARRGVEAFARPFLDDERRARINFVEIVGVSHELELHRRATQAGFSQLIAAAVGRLADAGLLDRRPPANVLMPLVGATQEPLDHLFHLPPRERPDVADVLDGIVAVYEAVLT